jgi:hypothetical protein
MKKNPMPNTLLKSVFLFVLSFSFISCAPETPSSSASSSDVQQSQVSKKRSSGAWKFKKILPADEWFLDSTEITFIQNLIDSHELELDIKGGEGSLIFTSNQDPCVVRMDLFVAPCCHGTLKLQPIRRSSIRELPEGCSNIVLNKNLESIEEIWTRTFINSFTHKEENGVYQWKTHRKHRARGSIPIIFDLVKE